MNEELRAMEANNTRTSVSLPANKHAIRCRWVYKVKYKADGSLDKYKSYLVAKEYTQEAGVRFMDTFSLVVKLATV